MMLKRPGHLTWKKITQCRVQLNLKELTIDDSTHETMPKVLTNQVLQNFLTYFKSPD